MKLYKFILLTVACIFLFSSFVFAARPQLVLTNQTILNSTETAYIFNDPSNVAVNTKVKLKDHLYLNDKEKIKQYQLSYKVPSNSRALKFDKIVERANNKYDFKVSTIEGSSIDFHLVEDNGTRNISITRYENLPTEVARVENISLDYATVTLAKTYDTYISHVLHSEDGITFTDSGLEFSQNKTHIWFNTTHFSSFTGSIPNFDLIIGGAIGTFDINDYATIDSGHYVKIFYPDNGGSSTISNKGFTGSDFVCAVATNDFDNDAFQVCLNADFEVILDALSGYDTINDDVTACIYTSGDSLEDCDTFNVEVRDFVLPYCTSAVSETDITKTSATLRGRVYFGDFTGSVTGANGYREFGSGDPYDYDSLSAISDGVIFTRGITGLTPDTTYQSLVKFSYVYESVTYIDFCDASGLFATLADVSPSVTTLSATDITSTTASLRGLPDKGDFTGTVTGHFWYKKVADSTWVEVEYGAITDDTVFSSGLSSLTTDEQYHYFASVEWTDGTPQVVDGSIVTFTPSDPTSSSSAIQDFHDINQNDAMYGGGTAYYGASKFEKTGTGTYDIETAQVHLLRVAGFTGTTWTVEIQTDSSGEPSGTAVTSGSVTETITVPLYSSDFYADAEWFNFTFPSNVTLNFDTSYWLVVKGNGGNQGRWTWATSDNSTHTARFTTDNGASWSGTNYIGNYYLFQHVEEIPDLPQTTTLSPTNVNQSNATLRGISDFKTFTGDVFGTFQYKLNTTSTWTNAGDTVNPISNDTIFSWTIGELVSDTQYDYRSVLTWFDGESLNAFGDMVSFDTTPYSSLLTDLGTDQIGDTYARLGFNLTFNDMTWVNYIISWDEWSAIQGGSPVWNDIGPTNTTSEGFVHYNLTGLTSGTKYGFYVAYQDSVGVKYSDIIDFTPGSENIPQIGSVLFTDITRTESVANVEVLSKGVYEEFLMKGFLSYAGEDNFSEVSSEVITTTGNYTYDLVNLTINQTYDYYLEITYSDGLYNTSLYFFETLSLADTIPPFMNTLDATGGNGEFTLDVEIIMNEQDVAGLRFNILGALNSTYPNGLLTNYDEINESGNYSYLFTNIDQGNFSARAELRYYNGTLPTPVGPIQPEFYDYIYTDYENFLVREADIDTQCIEPFPGVGMCITDPYLFVLLFLNGVIICSLGFVLAYGNTSSSSEGVNKFLLWATLGFSIIALIWLNIYGLIPTWQITVTLAGLVIIGVYYILEGNR